MRVALIGLGPMGIRHISAISRVDGLELVAVCDMRQEALDNPAVPPDAVRYRGAGELLEQEAPELVILSTSGPSHHPLCLEAIRAGVRRILAEKPMACSLGQAREMIDAAGAAGALLAVNHSRRVVPAYRWLAGRLASGEWGTLRGIRSSCPGIGLGCLATHFLDLARFLAGEDFVAVAGWVDPQRGINPRGDQYHDPGGLVVATFASGAKCVHHQIEDGSGPVSLALDLTSARVMVEEREGKMEILWKDPSVKPGPGRPARFEAVSLPEEAPLRLDLVEMTAEVLRDLKVGGELRCGALEGYRSLEAVVGTHLSNSRNHLPVGLPLEGPEALALELAIT